VLLDNGGETADRYTLFDTKPFYLTGYRKWSRKEYQKGIRKGDPAEGYIWFVAFNNRPYDPQGFAQHGEITVAQFNRHKAERFRALGKPIKLEAMSADAQKFAKRFMDESLAEG
jgi:hypothetical protein